MKYWDVPQENWSARTWKAWVWMPLRTMPDLIEAMPIKGRMKCHAAEVRANQYIERVEKLKERFQMAKAKKKETWMTEWAHVEMTPDQKGEYRAWDFEADDVLEAMGGYLSTGYKLSCNYNGANDTYQAALICIGEEATNSGWGVSGYAKNLWDAIRVLMYKVVVILPEDWSKYEPEGGTDIG